MAFGGLHPPYTDVAFRPLRNRFESPEVGRGRRIGVGFVPYLFAIHRIVWLCGDILGLFPGIVSLSISLS